MESNPLAKLSRESYPLGDQICKEGYEDIDSEALCGLDYQARKCAY